MLRVLKRLGILLAIGGVLGIVIAMLVAPSAVTWFQTPGTGTALCNCADVAKQAAKALIEAELIGAGVGALVLAVVGELLYRLFAARKRRRALPPPAAPPSPSNERQ
jgi:hypothetical protein